MRFAFVPFVFFAASFSLVAAQTATPPPNLAPNKTDQARPPSPATNVNVLNFPETQEVTGTVSVGNLPLDADGAVRVTSAPAAPMVWYQVLDTPITSPPSQGVHEYEIPTTIDTAGFASIAVRVESPQPACGVSFRLVSRILPDDPFLEVADYRSPGGSPVRQGGYGGYHVFTNFGSETRVIVDLVTCGNLVPATVSSIRVYLFP